MINLSIFMNKNALVLHTRAEIIILKSFKGHRGHSFGKSFNICLKIQKPKNIFGMDAR